jgi:hypothetical protein
MTRHYNDGKWPPLPAGFRHQPTLRCCSTCAFVCCVGPGDEFLVCNYDRKVASPDVSATDVCDEWRSDAKEQQEVNP